MSEDPLAQHEDLIRLAQDGDQAAWTALVEQHTEGLRRRIRGRMGGPVRRRVSESDVLQEAWIVAERRLGDFESHGPEAFRAWLGLIAENTVRGLIKRHAGAEKRDARTEVARGARAETAQHLGQDPTASALAVGREMRERIGAAMSELPQDYKTVIELLQHRRVTIGEASELMGRTPNAVKKLHGRALAELASLLDVRGRRHPRAD